MSKMSLLSNLNLKKILKDTPEAQLVALSRFKSDIVITLKGAAGGQNSTIIIPAGYPTPLTDQASLQALADSVDLQRYLNQEMIYLVEPESVADMYLKEARRLVAKANNSYIHEDNDDELANLDELLANKPKTENGQEKEVEIPAALRNDLTMINNFLKTGNKDDARSKLIQLSVNVSNMDAIYAHLTPCAELDEIKAEIAAS
ncbi:hypothetical protein [Yersinia ruckeri]|uniref:hypothetical protein n=1 Tax=Yersinia ruckeri TaxID=29486 RepID=UPI002238D79E|nr:hypothetical protein [Yersinia ruckeri]MCW6598657.1 hypothetical protein [Yersinia ruckeri]